MLDKYLLASISLVLLLTCFDLQRSYLAPIATDESSQSIPDDSISSIPQPKIKIQGLTTIKIRYCYSCGYQNLYKQFSELVQRDYSNIAIIGENHPPPPLKALLSKMFSFIKMGLLICLLFGQNPFPYLNYPTPRIFSWALQNKMYACLMIFFFSNTIESYLISTGAFEISVNNIPLWSKLETGRVPSTDEFIQTIKPFAMVE